MPMEWGSGRGRTWPESLKGSKLNERGLSKPSCVVIPHLDLVVTHHSRVDSLEVVPEYFYVYT